MNSRERVQHAINFESPDAVPLFGGFSPSTWHKYREELIPLAKRLWTDASDEVDVPYDFDKFPPAYRPGERFTDSWGCVWDCKVGGMEGIISKHPLDDWSKLENYWPPDPLIIAERGPRYLDKILEKANSERDYFMWSPYERFWERIHFLRGYENSLMDLAVDEPNIIKLMDMVLEHNMRFIDAVKDSGVDGLMFGDDWGDQQRLMVSPDMWRQYFKEPYRKMFTRCREAGKEVYFHTDGHLLPVIEDLIECGVTALNLQEKPNGIDNIAKLCKGNVCVAIDIDRQELLPFGTPEEIKRKIMEYVEKLDSCGGVILQYDIYPDVPLRNIEALAEIVEEIRGI